MNKLILQYILLFGLIINSLLAFSQKHILKLDDSKSYELYFVCRDPHQASDNYIYIVEGQVYNSKNDSIYTKNKNLNPFVPKYPYIYNHSNKTGMTFTLDTNFSFCVTDQSIIKKLEKDWIGKKRSRNKDCGCPSDYLLFIVESGKIISHLAIREEHRDAIFDNWIIDYSGNPLDSLDKSNKIISAYVQCTSIKQKSNFIEDAKQISGAYGFDNFDIPKYNGSFTLVYKGKRTNRVERKVKNKIIKACPGEKFDIEASREWETDTITVVIMCNKTLAENYALFEKEIEWWPFNISPVKIFIKDKALADQLIEKYTKE